MDPIEAYEHTINKLAELEDAGIQVAARPSKARTDNDLIEKYDRPERIPPQFWIHVKLQAETDEQVQLIRQARKELSKAGISFDTGGMSGFRDWELDWSFKSTGERDKEWEEAADAVDDLIGGLGDPAESE